MEFCVFVEEIKETTVVIETGGRDWEGTQKTNDFAVESKKQGEQDGEKWLRNLPNSWQKDVANNQKK